MESVLLSHHYFRRHRLRLRMPKVPEPTSAPAKLGRHRLQAEKNGYRRLGLRQRLQTLKFVNFSSEKSSLVIFLVGFYLPLFKKRLLFFAFLKDPAGAALKRWLRLSAPTDKKIVSCTGSSSSSATLGGIHLLI